MLSVFNIQRFSLHDGNGVRTVIFFKGCPLHCMWCNNPESIDPGISIMFDYRLCRRFGECIKAGASQISEQNGSLVINRDKIISPGLLRDVCPAKALWTAGREMSIPEILAEIEKDVPFYEMSSGGITLSGGEPFAQGGDLKELLIHLKKRDLHVSVETSLHIPWEKVTEHLALIDVFLADLKHTDPMKFQEYTGGDLRLVTGNLTRLDSEGKEFVVRVPVIPGFNHSEPEIFAIIETAAGLKNAREIHFIPYHSLATEKYHMLGKEYAYPGYRNVEKDELIAYTDFASKKGLVPKILN